MIGEGLLGLVIMGAHTQGIGHIINTLFPGPFKGCGKCSRRIAVNLDSWPLNVFGQTNRISCLVPFASDGLCGRPASMRIFTAVLATAPKTEMALVAKVKSAGYMVSSMMYSRFARRSREAGSIKHNGSDTSPPACALSM